MFTEALSTIFKTWRQPKYPSADEWIKKMWCINTMEYYSAAKKNEIMPSAATRMQLEVLTLSEMSREEKDKYPMISLICEIQNMAQMNLSTEQKQTHRHGEQTCCCQGRGRESGMAWEFEVSRCKLSQLK
uniref:Uncharacterized protein n=1 Tax=Sus scrofa TaxID=9823 RepID=A0A8D0R4F5_PIG